MDINSPVPDRSVGSLLRPHLSSGHSHANMAPYSTLLLPLARPPYFKALQARACLAHSLNHSLLILQEEKMYLVISSPHHLARTLYSSHRSMVPMLVEVASAPPNPLGWHPPLPLNLNCQEAR